VFTALARLAKFLIACGMDRLGATVHMIVRHDVSDSRL
jgi:hypothetical protein